MNEQHELDVDIDYPDNGAAMAAGADATPAVDAPESPAPKQPWLERLSPLFCWLMLLVGAGLRVRELGANRSLSMDEAALANDILARAWHRISVAPPDGSISAGFGAAVKAWSEVLGVYEWSLRLAPLVMGLFALGLAWRLSRRCLPKAAAPVVLAFFAFSAPLVWSSVSVAPYSTDLAVALFLLWGIGSAAQGRLTFWRMLGLMVIGAGAPWVSLTAPLVLLGAAMALILWEFGRGRPGRAVSWCITTAVWVWSVFLCFMVAFRRFDVVSSAPTGWREYVMPWSPWQTQTVGWLLQSVEQFFQCSAGFTFVGLALLLFVLGCIQLGRTRPALLAVLLGPVAATLLAAALHLYPFGARQLIFLAGPAIILVCAGLVSLFRSEARGARGAAILAGALLLAHPLYIATSAPQELAPAQGTRPVLRMVGERHRPGDTLYVHENAVPAVRFYVDFSRMVTLNDMPIIEARAPVNPWENPADHLLPLQGKRVWFFFTDVRPGEKEFWLYHLDLLGMSVDHFTRPGASVYLYDLSDAARVKSRMRGQEGGSGPST